MQVLHPVWSTADFQHEDMHDYKLLRLLSYLTLPRRRAVIGVPLLRQVQTCLLHKIFSAHSLAIHFEVSHPLGRATAFCTPSSWCEPSRDKIWQGRTFIGANFIATFCPKIIFRGRTIFFVTNTGVRMKPFLAGSALNPCGIGNLRHTANAIHIKLLHCLDLLGVRRLHMIGKGVIFPSSRHLQRCAHIPPC